VPDFSGTGLIESPVKAIEMWQLEFDAIRAADGCFVLTNHPFLSGRPSRAHALDGLIEYVCSHADVWVTSIGEIASHIRSLDLIPRAVERPDPRDF
jgi:peptidoglycan-N-acetylglucosamine deacetylase